MKFKPLFLSLFICFSLYLSLSGQDGYNRGMTGEVTLFAGNYAPDGWAFCQGQTLSIAQYTPLFAILGNQYGGDGQTSFRLPNLPGVPAVPLLYENGISRGGGRSVSFTATNLTEETVDMYWIDFDGMPKKFGVLEPNQSLKQLSGSQQVWHFRQGGKLIHTLLLNDQAQQQVELREPTMVRYIICLEGNYPSR